MSLHLQSIERTNKLKKIVSLNAVFSSFQFRYVTKYDQDVYHSDGHPNLERIEKSTVMHQALMAASTRGTGEDNGEGSTKSTQIRRKDSDVALYCRNHDINLLTELLADC